MEYPHLSFQQFGTNLFPVELAHNTTGRLVRYFNPADPSGLFVVTGRIDCIRYANRLAGDNGPRCMFLKAETDSPVFQRLHLLQMRHLRDVMFWDLTDAAIRQEPLTVRGMWIEAERYRFLCPNVAVDLDDSVYIVVDYIPPATGDSSAFRVQEGDAVTLACALIRQDRYNLSVECSAGCFHESLPRVTMYSVRAFSGHALEEQPESEQDQEEAHGRQDAEVISGCEEEVHGDYRDGVADEEVDGVADEEVDGDYEDGVADDHEDSGLEQVEPDETDEVFGMWDMNVTGMGI